MILALDSTLRSYSKDGRLHIARSHISKACVNPYRGNEIPHHVELGLDPDKVYYFLRDPEELAKGADTFRMLPILNIHIGISNFDTMAEQEKKKHIVGTSGSEVEFLHPFLDSDVTIWENHAIVGIETDKIREFSCSYHWFPIMSKGTFEGVPYDGIMTQLVGNHIALVESGRAGPDCLAADQQLEIDMAYSKFGKGIKVALTTAFPKVKAGLANDSELDKILASATRKGFDKSKALPLILAMDADIEPQASAVMDALMDVDDPEPKKHPKDCDCKECNAAEDEEDDEDEDEKKRKAAKDKKARDKAKDEEKEETKKEIKTANDSLERKLRDEFKAIDEAKRDVRPVVGDVLAMDSAEAIYDFALDHLKVDHTGVEGVTAKRALLNLAKTQKASSPYVPVAMDSAFETDFPSLAKNAARIRIM